MDPLTAGVVAGGISSAGGIYQANKNQKMQRETNAHNAAMAREQMAFQERMSNSAHQREAKDLEAAGLNRILGVSGSGASAPGGASSTSVAPTDQTGSVIRDAMNSGLAVAQTESNLAIQSAEVAKKLSEARVAIQTEPDTISSAKSKAHQEFSGRYIKNAERDQAEEAAKQERLRTEREKADTPRAIEKSALDRDFQKAEKILKTVNDGIGAAASSAAALSRRGSLMNNVRPPTIRAGSRRETRELLKAGRKGLEVE